MNPDDLQHIAERTLAHYEQHAQSYWEGTRDHDVSQNIAALLQHLPGPPPFDLLDFGCGPGRDLRTFKALGHRAVGLEGAPSVAALARALRHRQQITFTSGVEPASIAGWTMPNPRSLKSTRRFAV
jgi:SAM-dependent methyltransferase